MKLLVDEMPYFKDDCWFAKQIWSDEEATWVNYCKFTTERCDLDFDKEECSCLKLKGEN